jgi:transposase
MAKHSVEQGGMGDQALGVGGIDVAKDWHYIQWLDGSGRPVGKAFRFANTRAGFEAMWDRRPSDAVRIGMESTGHYWLGLAHWLRAQGAEVVLVQPAHVHRLKELDDNTPTKTDAKDARVIARLVFDDRWFRWEPRAGALAQLATLAVTRRQHHQDVMRWRARIAGWLHQYFPEFLTVFKAWDGKAALTVLDAQPTPDLVLVAPVEALTTQFKAATKHRVGAKRAHALHRAAGDSIGIPEGRVTARLQLASYLGSWRAALAAQTAIEAEQAAILADLAPAQPLFSIPGFGPQVIATLLGELGDLSRFADPRQAQKMAGLNLTQISSGHHQGQTHIAKRGRPAARAVLYQAACVAVAKDPQWKAWYQSLTRRAAHPLAPKAAMVAVATKLLRVAWACMKHGQGYDAARLFPIGEVPTAA